MENIFGWHSVPIGGGDGNRTTSELPEQTDGAAPFDGFGSKEDVVVLVSFKTAASSASRDGGKNFTFEIG
ncbi:MAG: hypothetical protein O2960_06925 [Verrucomicrobia bacterium]|nr:hypothetical protein [Verrucomicrobiota bacterium]